MLQHFHTLILKNFFLIACLNLLSSVENSYSFVLLPLSPPTTQLFLLPSFLINVDKLVLFLYPRAPLPLFHFVSILTICSLLILRKDVKQKFMLSAIFSTRSTTEGCSYTEIMPATCHLPRILTLLF